LSYKSLAKYEKKKHKETYGKLSKRLLKALNETGESWACLVIRGLSYHEKSKLTPRQRSSIEYAAFRQQMRRKRYQRIRLKLKSTLSKLKRRLALEGVIVKKSSLVSPIVKVRLKKRHIPFLESFEFVGKIFPCEEVEKTGKPITIPSNETWDNIRMGYLWSSLVQYVSEKQPTSICILEKTSVQYSHGMLHFSRKTTHSPGNSNTIPEANPSSAEECKPIRCSTNGDCSSYSGKTTCVKGRCASGISCSSSATCSQKYETCQPDGSSYKCQEACPNSLQVYSPGGGSEYSHATKVAGIINALSTPTGVTGGSINSLIFNANTTDKEEGFDWCAKKKVDIINQSYIFGLGANTPNQNGQITSWGYLADWYSQHHNLLVIAGGGNEVNFQSPKYTENVSRNGITVGGYNHAYYQQGIGYIGTASWSDDTLVGYNSLNPITPHHDLMKPDLIAPSENIKTTLHGGGTTVDSGTSLSTPFISAMASQIFRFGAMNCLYGYGAQCCLNLQCTSGSGFDFMRGKPQMVKAILKTASCNRVQNASNYVIGEGGPSGKLVSKILEDARDKFYTDYVYYLYQMAVNPQINPSPVFQEDFYSSSGYYKWSVDGRVGMQCITVQPNEKVRISISWESNMNGSSSSPSFAGHVDLDLHLFEHQHIGWGQHTGPPIKVSNRWDDTTETVEWENTSSAPKTVCFDIYRFAAPSNTEQIRLAWAIAKYITCE
jgi:hypothetical protein